MRWPSKPAALPSASALALAACLVLAGTPARAEPPTRDLRETFGASVNTLGVQHAFEAAWNWRTGHSTNPLLSDAHLAMGLTNHVSPTYLRVGGWAAWAPLSVLELRVGVEPVFYFGMLGSLIGFDHRYAAFDEDARRALRPQAVPGLGARFHAGPTLRARVGRVVASSTVEYERWRVNAPGAFFYEPMRDTLLDSDGDSLWHASTVLLLESHGGGGRGLLAGLHHTLVYVPDSPDNKSQRLGPLAVWTLGDRRFGVREPALIADVYFYLDDPYKRHELGASLGVRFGMGH